MYEQIEANKRKTILLLAFFLIFAGAMLYFLSMAFGFGLSGFGVMGILLIIYALISYKFSAQIVLKISHAKEAPREKFTFLHNVVEGLAIAAGIPKPKLYVIEDTALNAFATGNSPENSVIVVTTGLLDKMNRLELEGVIAHEMSHIKNYDIRVMTLTVLLVGVISLVSDVILRAFFWGRHDREMNRATLVFLIVGIIFAIFAPLIAQLIKLAVSRTREFLADADGAMLTRYPEGLASALEKISKDKEPLEAANKATAHLYIENPLKNYSGFVDRMFSTHPPIKERIGILRGMGK